LFCIGLLTWLLLFALLRTTQHFSFATNTWDLSIYDYAMASTLKGEPMFEPFHAFGWGSHLAVHFTPVLFLLAPLYLVFTGPLFLLYIQVIAVGAAAIPLYLIARRELGEGWPALLPPLLFLLYRPLLNGLMYDFHPEMFFPLCIFSSYYFLAFRRRHLPFLLFIILALWLKEDFAAYTIFYCIWLARKSEWRRTALMAALLGAIYLFLTLAIFIPHFQEQLQTGRGYEFIGRWQDYGRTPMEIAGHALKNPLRVLQDLRPLANLARLANFFLPLLFVPCGSSAVLLIIPPIVVAWLSRIPTMAAFGLHYGSALIPFLFLALVLTLARWKKIPGSDRSVPRLVGNWLLPSLLLVSLINFKWNLFDPGKYASIRHYSAVKLGLERIPAGAPLAAQSVLIPHLPRRREIFMLPEKGRADFIVFHLDLNPWPIGTAELQDLDGALSHSPQYALLHRSGGLRIYKKVP
jgi:uncharacterized membrane protein